MNPIVHFEIPVNDLKRAAAFYRNSFGWTVNEWKTPDGKLEYWSVLTKDAQGNGIDGGMMKKMNPGHMFTNYLTVDDIDSMLKTITANGGKVCMPKKEIAPGMGWVAMFSDPDGNILGLHQVSPEMKAKMAAQKKPAKKTAMKAPVKKKAAKKKK